MDFTMKALTGPLTTYMKGFPAPPRLHPFERALLDLTVGEERYVGVLQRVDSLRKRLTEVSEWIRPSSQLGWPPM
jgi:nucleolar GTP-binding protein